jgi:hypothetical protein
MKILLIAIVLLSKVIQAQAQWTQPEFIIGSWRDPRMTGDTAADNARLMRFKAAYFNTLSGLALDPTLAPAPQQQSTLADDFNGTATSITYRLRRLASVGGLRMFSADERYYGEGLVYNSANVQAVINDYSTLSPALRSCLIGYHIADEPSWLVRDRSLQQLSKITHFASGDPALLPWVNLFANRVNEFIDDEPAYIEYVRRFANSGTRVISFDNYPFSTNQFTTPPPNQPAVRISNRYFRNYQIIADEARNAGVNFWAFANSTGIYFNDQGKVWVVKDGPADYRALNQPRTRFGAYVPLIYGAKGIFWHVYEPVCLQTGGCFNPASPAGTYPTVYDNSAILDRLGNTTTMYGWVSTINQTIKNFGPTLLSARWLGTVHGSATNIMNTSNDVPPDYTGAPEANLPVITATTELIEVNGISPNPQNFAIGLFEGLPPFYYLLVLNKDTETGTNRTVTINLKPTVRQIARHDRISDSWTVLPGTTSVTLTLAPGDIQMIRLDKSRVRKYFNHALR